MQDFGPLSSTLAAAVGDDVALKAELCASFLAGADRLVDQLAGSRCDANWRSAALRLQGLAASFCANALIDAAAEAATGAPGDPVALRKVRAAVIDLHLASRG